MSNIPSIPPLLCSTPPPIDFGDEDDDDATLPTALNLDYDIDYAAYTPQLQTIGTNPDVPSLPHTPVQLDLSCSTAASQLPNFQTETTGDEKLQVFSEKLKEAKPIEAFNYAISTTMLESNSPPPLEFCDPDVVDQLNIEAEYEEDDFHEYCNAPTDSDPGGSVDLVDEEEIGTKNEDNISLPSLKFDTLSISSEKFSACSPTPMSLLADDDTSKTEIIDCVATQKNETTGRCHQQEGEELHYEVCMSPNLPQNVVKLEDLLDDSSDDELHSPIKTKNICADESTVDFFAIHAINDDNQAACSNNINNKIPAIEDTYNIHNKLEERDNKKLFGVTEEHENDDDFNDFTDFADFQSNVSPSVLKELHQTEQVNQELAFDVDFEHYNTVDENLFQQHNITSKNLVKKHEHDKKQSQSMKTEDESNYSVDDDEFEDFQDFTADVQRTEVSAEKLQNAVPEDTVNANDAQEEDNDDEFGDFSDATFTPAIEPAATEPFKFQAIPVTRNNLNDRLKPILDMMFPYVDSNAKTVPKDIKPMIVTENSNSLELAAIDTAKALEYRWTKSEIRHSLIRSLGIDSRNILFGDKWNSSMPRFGTTMSLQPLEPLKPQQVNQHSSIADAGHSNTTTTKPDVPAVEFDWNSSGLVNPLDGPKEVSHPRETETVYTPQSGTADASTYQQQPHSAFASDDISNLAVNANINTTAATPTVVDTAATTTISSTISTDSISNHFDDNVHNVDISMNLQTSQKTNNAGTNSSIITPAAAILSYELETFSCSKVDLPDIITIEHDEVVTTSTFSGPLKETHIYTPSKNDATSASTKSGAITKTIDFDYEIAAAGIIIDETVVKKEYRDVEYNPKFGLAFDKTQPTELNASSENTTFNDFFGTFQSEYVGNGQHNYPQEAYSGKSNDDGVFDDEFSDFQSVQPNSVQAAQPQTAVTMRTKDIVANNSESRNSTPIFGSGREMILSPAILLPQAISMESNKPKIEWGDTTANINPEELARIEELFPQPKTDALNLQKSTPIHNGFQKQLQKSAHNSLSISATIAQKELHVDDDDWSEFVSVPAVEPVQPKIPAQHTIANNNNHFSSPAHRLHQHQHQQQQQRQSTHSSPRPTKATKNVDATATTEEEWSDFVSSTPVPNTQYRAMPQFNSAAWQNANFYNNPLSFYQGQTQTHSKVVSKLHNNNSTTSNYNNNFNKYLMQQQQLNQQSQQMQLQQQIHVMQDFSTAPPSLHRSSNAASVLNTNSQFQVGSAKIAPSISLIPDLGFIAPAAPTHTAFINTLPKPSFSTKK